MGDLYSLLAEAYAQPSRASRTFTEGVGAIENIDKGFQAARKRKMDRSTLSEILGGRMVPGLEPFSDMSSDQISRVAPLAPFIKSDPNENWLTKFNLQQDAIGKRQKDRQNFIRSMVGAKGNKDAVNSSKNAVQGLGYVRDLWSEMDKLSPEQKVFASNDVTGKLFPVIQTYKQNIRRTAGFSEGGKNLTSNELEVVVNSFEPTLFDNPKSRVLKEKIARDFYSGTIDLFEAARLLGPAGAKLQEMAIQQRKRQAMGQSLLEQEAGFSNDADDPFSAEGF